MFDDEAVEVAGCDQPWSPVPLETVDGAVLAEAAVDVHVVACEPSTSSDPLHSRLSPVSGIKLSSEPLHSRLSPASGVKVSSEPLHSRLKSVPGVDTLSSEPLHSRLSAPYPWLPLDSPLDGDVHAEDDAVDVAG